MLLAFVQLANKNGDIEKIFGRCPLLCNGLSISFHGDQQYVTNKQYRSEHVGVTNCGEYVDVGMRKDNHTNISRPSAGTPL
jgi:hypothetical protein